MRKFVLPLLLLFTLRPIHAQPPQPVLRWVTADGTVGAFSPAGSTFTENQLPFSVVTHNLTWLNDGQHVIYQPDSPVIQIIDLNDSAVTCSVPFESRDNWIISPHQAAELLLYQINDNDQTIINRLNWRACNSETLAIVEGDVYSAAISHDVPLLAFSANRLNQASIHVIDLATNQLTTLDITPQANTMVYWTYKSTHLLIQNEQETLLFDRETHSTRLFDEIEGSVWPQSRVPLMLRSDLYSDLSTQFWSFENGQPDNLLFEIPDEVYDHEPGFSPDSRYYAYTQRSNLDRVMVLDWQQGEAVEVASIRAIKRWSPDSRWLTLIDTDQGEIWIHNMQTGAQQSYTGRINWYGDDVWSNDSAFIAFWQRDGDVDHLIVASSADGSISQVFDRQALDFPGSVRWSPDDAYLYVNAASIQADGLPTSCHAVVEFAAGITHELGCGDWTIHWTQ